MHYSITRGSLGIRVKGPVFHNHVSKATLKQARSLGTDSLRAVPLGFSLNSEKGSLKEHMPTCGQRAYVSCEHTLEQSKLRAFSPLDMGIFRVQLGFE